MLQSEKITILKEKIESLTGKKVKLVNETFNTKATYTLNAKGESILKDWFSAKKTASSTGSLKGLSKYLKNWKACSLLQIEEDLQDVWNSDGLTQLGVHVYWLLDCTHDGKNKKLISGKDVFNNYLQDYVTEN